MTTFEPPASSSTSPRPASHARTAQTSSSSLRASTTLAAGPPRRSVVSGASGTPVAALGGTGAVVVEQAVGHARPLNLISEAQHGADAAVHVQRPGARRLTVGLAAAQHADVRALHQRALHGLPDDVVAHERRGAVGGTRLARDAEPAALRALAPCRGRPCGDHELLDAALVERDEHVGDAGARRPRAAAQPLAEPREHLVL